MVKTMVFKFYLIEWFYLQRARDLIEQSLDFAEFCRKVNTHRVYLFSDAYSPNNTDGMHTEMMKAI